MNLSPAEIHREIPIKIEGLRLIDADWLTDSTFVIGTEEKGSVYVVRADGTVARVGRIGDGPGEMRSVLALVGSDSGRFWLLDGALQRVSLFSGELYVTSVATAGRALGAWPSEGGAVWIKSISDQSRGLQLTRVELREGRTLSLDADVRRKIEACTVCFTSVAPDGAIASAPSPTEYHVLRGDRSGRELRAIHREDLPVVEFTESELDSLDALRREAIPMMSSSGLTDSSIAKLLGDYHGPLVKGVLSAPGLRHDNRRRLWVQRSVNRGAVGIVDVYGEDGTLSFSVQLPAATRVIRVRDGQILAARALSDGTDQVVILRYAQTFGQQAGAR